MHARVKKLNFHANTSAAAKRNEINPKYENMRKKLRRSGEGVKGRCLP
jgi:hypothetical protein